MRTKAQAMIQARFVERGETMRIVVLPLPGTGLPEELVEAGRPVSLDLLAGRPVRLELDPEGLSADLCFGGPPVRCRLPWNAVLAVQGEGDELEQTLAVTVAVRMEDDSLAPVSVTDAGSAGLAGSSAEERPRPRPHLRLVED